MSDSIKAILLIPLPTLIALEVLGYFWRRNNRKR
jgi:hypothetical protein